MEAATGPTTTLALSPTKRHDQDVDNNEINDAVISGKLSDQYVQQGILSFLKQAILGETAGSTTTLASPIKIKVHADNKEANDAVFSDQLSQQSIDLGEVLRLFSVTEIMTRIGISSILENITIKQLLEHKHPRDILLAINLSDPSMIHNFYDGKEIIANKGAEEILRHIGVFDLVKSKSYNLSKRVAECIDRLLVEVRDRFMPLWEREDRDPTYASLVALQSNKEVDSFGTILQEKLLTQEEADKQLKLKITQLIEALNKPSTLQQDSISPAIYSIGGGLLSFSSLAWDHFSIGELFPNRTSLESTFPPEIADIVASVFEAFPWMLTAVGVVILVGGLMKKKSSTQENDKIIEEAQPIKKLACEVYESTHPAYKSQDQQ